jgi:hypothetical protein
VVGEHQQEVSIKHSLVALELPVKEMLVEQV